VDAVVDLVSGFLGGRVAAWVEPSSRFSAKGAVRRVSLFGDRKRLQVPVRMTSRPVGTGKVSRTTFGLAIDGGRSPHKITKGWWDASEYGPFEDVVGDGVVTAASDRDLHTVVWMITPLGRGRVRDLEFIETDWAILQEAAREGR